MRGYFIWAGVFSLVVALIVIALCWMLNPWFNFWNDAFSDFGTSRACCPWLYNQGLILSSLLFSLFSLQVLASSRGKVEAFSSGLLFTASLFLALIGIFPGGTRPHTFVSTWFFVQTFLGFAVLGSAIYLKGDSFGLLTALASGFAIPLAIVIEVLHGWPSAAVAEAVGIAIMAISLVLVSMHYRA